MQMCCRSLLAGQEHDLQTVFRLCQLWFTLNSSEKVNTQMAEAFRQTPSYKFLPLVYQLASRLTTVGANDSLEAAFQVCFLPMIPVSSTSSSNLCFMAPCVQPQGQVPCLKCAAFLRRKMGVSAGSFRAAFASLAAGCLHPSYFWDTLDSAHAPALEISASANRLQSELCACLISMFRECQVMSAIQVVPDCLDA